MRAGGYRSTKRLRWHSAICQVPGLSEEQRVFDCCIPVSFGAASFSCPPGTACTHQKCALPASPICACSKFTMAWASGIASPLKLRIQPVNQSRMSLGCRRAWLITYLSSGPRRPRWPCRTRRFESSSSCTQVNKHRMTSTSIFMQ